MESPNTTIFMRVVCTEVTLEVVVPSGFRDDGTKTSITFTGRLGGEAGVPTPVNLEIYERLLPLEERSRGLRS